MKKTILFALLFLIVLIVAIVLVGCFGKDKQSEVFKISSIKSLIISEIQTDLPQILISTDNKEQAKAHYDLFWFNASYVYVQEASIYIKPSAPSVFEDKLIIKLKTNISIFTTIKLYRPYIEAKSLSIKDTPLLVGEESRLTAVFVPHNTTSKNLTWEIIYGNAKITNDGIITPQQFNQTVVIKATGANGTYATISLGVDARILITNQTELSNIRHNPSRHFKLSNDIVLTGYWTPIVRFSGSLNGNGFSILNLNIRIDTTHYLTPQNFGLFGQLIGHVYNLKLENVNISSTAAQHSGAVIHVGAIAGTAEIGSTIKNSEITCGNFNITRIQSRTGGIVGRNSGVVTGSTNRARVHGQGDLGGIVGRNYGTTDGNFNRGEVSMWYHERPRSIGGIAGSNFGEIIANTNYGVVFVMNSVLSPVRAGSIIGDNHGFFYVCNTNRGVFWGNGSTLGNSRFLFANYGGAVGRQY